MKSTIPRHHTHTAATLLRLLGVALLLMFAASDAGAQSGFIKKYSFGGQPYVKFVDVIQESNGNLIAYGYAREDDPNVDQGFIVARLDTFGNIMNFSNFYIEDDATGYVWEREIVEAEDGNLLL